MEHVYKQIELTGSSKESIEDAIQNAVRMASRSLERLRWFEVIDMRGHIEDGEVAYYQVTLKIGFTLEQSVSADEH